MSYLETILNGMLKSLRSKKVGVTRWSCIFNEFLQKLKFANFFGNVKVLKMAL